MNFSVYIKIHDLTRDLQRLPLISKESQEMLDKIFRLEFNYHSNRIAGNTLTCEETKLLLFDQPQGNHTWREFEAMKAHDHLFQQHAKEMRAHDEAFMLIKDWAKDTERPLTEQDIKKLNEIIPSPLYSGWLEDWKMLSYPSPAETSKMIQEEVINWYQKEEKKPLQYPVGLVKLASLLHHKFVCIHQVYGWQERTARLLMNYVLLKHKLPPVVIKSADEKNYSKALNRARDGYTDDFAQYIAEQLVLSLEISIKAAQGENIEEGRFGQEDCTT